MKTLIAIGLAVILAGATQAQDAKVFVLDAPTVTLTNAPAPTTSWWTDIGSSIGSSGLLNATNWAFAPYLTYAPDNAAKEKFGGGFLAIFNITDYIGTALGVDWLGQFSLISGNVTLKVDTQPLKNAGWAPDWAKAIVVTPFGLAGIGSPLGGTGTGGAATIYDVGGAVKFGHLWGGRFGVGGTYGAWANVGDYSGKRYHVFLSWSKGF